MKRVTYFDRRYHPPGTPPGTYDAAHVRAAQAGTVRVIDYNRDELVVREGRSALDSDTLSDSSVRWINVTGMPSVELLADLERRFDIDPLVLEDMVSVGQRPKFNEYDNGLFISLNVPEDVNAQRFIQFSLFMRPDCLISVIDSHVELLDPLVARLKSGASLLRHGDASVLLYAVLDLAVDLLFPTTEVTGELLEDLEAEILTKPGAEVISRTHDLRSRLLMLRKNVWATREVTGHLIRHVEGRSEPERAIRPYLEDCYDHLVGLVDVIETQREIASSLVEIHLSVSSNRMNETMRLLTIIATLFIPPTLVSGIYGMNFDRTAGPLSMPELGWPLGYIGSLGAMALMMIIMLVYFRFRRWI